MTTRTSPAVPPEFSVLLGPDYSGKSSALEALSLAGWQSISSDDRVVQPVFGDLRKGFVKHVLPGMGETYSSDFVFTLLQASVVYLRDQVVRAAPNRPVIVDSYYYKILAKCVLTGLVRADMFAWWRSFPPPRRVIYLDVDPETAWRRSDQGARLNPLEYYGATPTLAGFSHFQTDLRRVMVREVGTVPLTVLYEPDSAEQAANDVRQILGSDDAEELTA